MAKQTMNFELSTYLGYFLYTVLCLVAHLLGMSEFRVCAIKTQRVVVWLVAWINNKT